MTRTTTFTLRPFILLTCSLALGGCNGAFVGNIVVLGMTVGIFFGTLALGRSTEARSATRSASGSKNG